MYSRCYRCGKLYLFSSGTKKCCGKMLHKIDRKTYKMLKEANGNNKS
jgi:hypothetical protein